jgi:hypothetical protein
MIVYKGCTIKNLGLLTIDILFFNIIFFIMKNLCKFHNSTILSGIIVLLMITGFLLSCSREEVKTEAYKDGVLLEKRTIEDCEPPALLECEKDTVLRVIYMDFFECPMGIEYERFICIDGGYYFGNFKIFAEDCDSFDTWIGNCMSSTLAFESCMEFLNEEIMKNIILTLLHIENPTDPIVTLTFFQAACNQWCLTQPYNPRDEFFYVLGKLRCSDACCEHEYIARKVNDVWTIVDENKTQVGGIGCEYVLQVESCDQGNFTSSCINECK